MLTDFLTVLRRVNTGLMTKSQLVETIVVEIDETLVVHRKYNSGRELVRTWLFGGTKRTSKKNFMIPLINPLSDEVKKRDKKTLAPIIKKYIKPASVFTSDCWSAYVSLSEEGHTHYSVNHSEHFSDLDNP